MSNQLPSVPTPTGTGLTRLRESPEAAAAYPAAAADGFPWRRYLDAVIRNKWLILAVTVLGAGGGVAIGRHMQPQYAAQVTIWIEAARDADGGPIRQAELLRSFAWVDLLKSYAVLDSAVLEQKLYLHPRDSADRFLFHDFHVTDSVRPGRYRFQVDEDGRRLTLAELESGAVFERRAAGDPIGAELGFHWALQPSELRAGRVVEFEVTNPRDESRRLGERIQTRMIQDGNFLRLELEGHDPEQITNTLNTVAERYVEVAAELKRVNLDERTAILEEQLRIAEDNLRDSEGQLESFRVQTITLPSDRGTPVAAGLEITRDPVFSSFFSMKIEQEQLRRDRESLRQALTQLARDGAIDGLEFIPAVRSSSEVTRALNELADKRAELRALRYRYTDEYPGVRRLAEEIAELERRTIPQLAGGLSDQLAAREAEIDARLRSAGGELQEIPARAIEEARLQRQVAIADNIYTSLRERYESSRLAAASSIPDVRILDRAAVPRRPVSDDRPRIVLLALMGSLGLGVLGAIVRDRFDPRFRYPSQVSEELGVAILGAVPHLGNGKRRSLTEEAAAQVIEALREVRLGVLSAFGTAGPVTFAVTSPGAGDGKSFISSNLSVALAKLGRRTLLVDGDIRRGALHRLFAAERKPGLTDFLSGNAPYDRIIQRTPFESLDLIACGRRMQHGPELLGSGAMGDLMANLKANYDVIVIDCPPLGAGVDPLIIGALTGNMVLVMRAGKTDRIFAESKLRLVDRLPIRILGAVLNDVPERGLYQYYGYLPGYAAEDEAYEVEPPLVRG